MERSAIKGMSLLTLDESDHTKRTRPKKRDIGRIRVRGYNTDLRDHRCLYPRNERWSTQAQWTRPRNLVELTWEDGPSLLSLIRYDTLLDKADIEKMLFEHFSSCGEVTRINVHESIGAAVVDLYGEDAEEKVMYLDGSNMVGRKISVKLYTVPTVYSVHPRPRRNRTYYPG
ncbi:Nucleotide-binding alpha-beta plait domain protein [Raphanus sativus]|nr:Nucleotide-binding alpha-beta plait domain protein [Raphanus sativus]